MINDSPSIAIALTTVLITQFKGNNLLSWFLVSYKKSVNV